VNRSNGEHTETPVKIIPIDQPFLRVLAGYCAEKFREQLPDLSRVLVVFPNQRSKFYFRRYLLEAAGRPALIPPVLKTIEELFALGYESRGGKRGAMLQRLERNFILKQTVDSLKVHFWQDLPFLKFIAVGDRVLQFFNELAEERVTLAEIQALKDEEHYPEKYVAEELAIFGRIQEAYRLRLAELGVQDDADLYDLIDREFDPGILASYSAVLIAGLAATTRIENRVLASLLKNLPAEIVLHSAMPEDLAAMTDTEKPFYLHRKLLDCLKVDPGTCATINATRSPPAPVFHVRGLPSEAQQTIYLRGVLAEAVRRHEPHRVAVVLPDEGMAHTVIEALRDLGIEHNLSLGFKFSGSLIHSFLRLLHDTARSGGHYREFFRLIDHPFVKNCRVDIDLPLRSLVYGLQRHMIENRLNYLRFLPEGPGEFEPLVRRIREALDAVQRDAFFPDYLAGIAGMLEAFINGNQGLLKTHGAEISEFIERWNGLARLRLPQGGLEPGLKMLEFALNVLANETYHRSGDPMRGVQVIGYLEARNLDFDCLIMPALNEGVFPPPSEKDLFVNQAVRRRVGLPYDQERDNLALFYFTELTAGKKEIFLTYLNNPGQDVRSRYIDLAAEEGGPQTDESQLLLDRAAVSVPPRGGEKDDRLLELLDQKIRRDGLSPSSLKDFRLCPYRFYLRYLAGIREPDGIVEEPDARAWGKAIHLALERFYREDYPRGFTERERDHARLVLGERLESCLREALCRQPHPAAFLDLPIYKRRLDHFLDRELVRFRTGFRIDPRKLEKWIYFHVTVAGRRIRLRGSIDRIDYQEDRPYIIDYKTGAKPRAKEYTIGGDFLEFQLPFYALCLTEGDHEKIAGLAFYVIGREIEIIEPGLETGLPKYLAEFEAQILKPVIAEILDPGQRFEPVKEKATCRNCPYAAICGVSSWQK
jgi:ATP-dependent helicase/nuclease subunit B